MPIKGRSIKQLGEQIREKLEQGHALDASHWKKINELHTLYNLIHRRTVKGIHFIGYGNWYSYLENELGIYSISHSHIPNEKLDYLVAADLQQQAKGGRRRTKAWVRHAIKARKVSGIRYMGHGSWENYLKKVHSAKLEKRPLEYSNQELHGKVRSLLEQMNWQTSTGHWQAEPQARIVYKEVVRRRFFDCNGWHQYLAKFVKTGLPIPFIGRNHSYRLGKRH